LAEGSTRSGIQTYLTVSNPNPTPETFTVLYLFADGSAPLPVVRTVAPLSRATVDADSDVGPDRDISMQVQSVSGHGLVVERPMYFGRSVGAAGAVTGGSVEHGAPAPRLQWLFAEGSTRDGFQTYLTLENPNPFPVLADVTFLLAGDLPVEGTARLAASSRETFDVNAIIGPGVDVSTEVFAEAPIIAERPTYFSRAIGVAGSVDDGAVTLGAPVPAAEWRFAEGSTRAGIQTYLTLENPNSVVVTARVTFLYTDGPPAAVDVAVDPEGRSTLDIDDLAGPERDVSLLVQATSGGGLVVERPTYFRRSIGAAGAVNGGDVALGSSG
jgi:P pilus assembly chaperone PapD